MSYSTPTHRSDIDLNFTTMDRADRVRWSAIFAGLFAALVTFILLNVLGAAIGLFSYDVGNPLGAFGIGAGIWGAVVTLISFIVGGWLAASSGAVFGRANGILNGAMVWVVAIPLLLMLLTSTVSTVIGGVFGVADTVASTAGSVVSTTADAAGGAITNATDALELSVSEQDVENVQATAQALNQEITVEDARATAQGVIDALPVEAAQATAAVLATSAAEALPSQAEVVNTVDQATDVTGTALFGTLLALLLGLGAAVLGGFLGARELASSPEVVATADRA